MQRQFWGDDVASAVVVRGNPRLKESPAMAEDVRVRPRLEESVASGADSLPNAMTAREVDSAVGAEGRLNPTVD